MPACTVTIFEYFMLSYFPFQNNSSFHNNLTEFFKLSSLDAFWPLATCRSNKFLHEFVEISKLKHFFYKLISDFISPAKTCSSVLELFLLG